MSRCYPFPPPGYVKNGLSGEALAEWYKRKRERATERAKAKKEKRKAKKSKEKRDKVDFKENLDTAEREQSHGRKQKEERRKVKDDHGHHAKGRKDETEQGQKSDVTEEHGQPSNDQKVYESSDSTQNRNKRKLPSTSSDGDHHYCGMPDLEALPTTCSCFASGRTEIVTHEKSEIIPTLEQLRSSSGRTGIQFQHTAEPDLGSSICQSRSKELDVQFIDLMEKWVAPALQLEHSGFDGMGWLFEKKQHVRHRDKIFNSSPAAARNGRSSIWPRACHLPEFDVYALPYTVPY